METIVNCRARSRRKRPATGHRRGPPKEEKESKSANHRCCLSVSEVRQRLPFASGLVQPQQKLQSHALKFHRSTENSVVLRDIRTPTILLYFDIFNTVIFSRKHGISRHITRQKKKILLFYYIIALIIMPYFEHKIKQGCLMRFRSYSIFNIRMLQRIIFIFI